VLLFYCLKNIFPLENSEIDSDMVQPSMQPSFVTQRSSNTNKGVLQNLEYINVNIINVYSDILYITNITTT
jgi:hypothetical protein